MKTSLLILLLFPFVGVCFVSCNLVSTKYPRVVKNGCGTYAVQMSQDEKTNVVYYLGVITYRPHYECYGDTMYATSGYGLTITGGTLRGPFTLGDCGYDTTNVELVKNHKHLKIWGDIKDTSYRYELGHELQFKTDSVAIAAMNSYLRRTNEEKAFTDSITLCHTYK